MVRHSKKIKSETTATKEALSPAPRCLQPPPEPPNFNPGEYEKIVKWAAGMALGTRFLQKMIDIPNVPNHTHPTDATYVAPVPVIPLQPDLP